MIALEHVQSVTRSQKNVQKVLHDCIQKNVQKVLHDCIRTVKRMFRRCYMIALEQSKECSEGIT